MRMGRLQILDFPDIGDFVKGKPEKDIYKKTFLLRFKDKETLSGNTFRHAYCQWR